MLKWLIPISLLTIPFWLGFLLLHLGGLIGSSEMKSYGFGIAAIVPQYVQCPYSSHYMNGHFPHYWIASAAHWLIVLLIYGIVCRRRSIGVSLAIFIGLGIASVILVHMTLRLSGYSFSIDSI